MVRLIIIILLITTIGCTYTSKPKNDKVIGTSKKKTIQREILSTVNYNKIFENKIVDKIPVEVLEIGELNLPTGKIVVCDPLVGANANPLNKTVKPGKYPVKIYIAKTKESGDRYAIAKLEFSSKKADKWVLALHDDEDTSKLKDSLDYFGFPVDAGLAGILDYKAGVEYRKFTDQFQKKNPGGNIHDNFLAAEFKKNAKEPNNPEDDGDWVNLKIPQSDLNIMMFQSGYGDGTYPAYWGMTKDNEIVSLVIDFFVLLPPGK